jgi:hypothetical protein
MSDERDKKTMEIRVNSRSVTQKADVAAHTPRGGTQTAEGVVGVSYRLEDRLLGRLFDRLGSGVVRGLKMPLKDKGLG